MEGQEQSNDESTFIVGALVVIVDVADWPAVKAAVKDNGARIVYQRSASKDKRLYIVEGEREPERSGVRSS